MAARAQVTDPSWASRGRAVAWSAALGLAGILSYGMRWLASHPTTSVGEIAFVSLYLALLFAALGRGWLRFVIEPRVRTVKPRQRSMLVIGWLLIGWLATYAIPTDPPGLPGRHRLEIIATGERHPSSQDSVVWVLKWPSMLTASSVSELWELRNGHYFSDQSQPASIVFEGWLLEGQSVDLQRSNSSGIVRVRWDLEDDREIDLYSETPQRFTIPGPAATSRLNAALSWATRCSDAVIIGVLGLGVGLFLLRQRIVPQATAPGMVRRVALYALPGAFVWSCRLLAYWPGLLSNDTLDQLRQYATGLYSDWHPIFHTLYLGLLTVPDTFPGSVGLVQLFALALIVGWGLAEFEAFGVPRVYLWATSCFIALMPANGLMAITLWKDVPFTLAILALTVLVVRIVRTHGGALAHRSVIASLGGIAALVALFRHNGPPTAFATLALLLFVYRSRWRATALSLAIGLALWAGIRGPGYQLLETNGQTQPGLLWPVLHQIGAHLAARTFITEAETSLVDQVIPIADGWPYVCTIVDPIAFNPAIDRPFAIDHLPDLARLSATLAIRNPRVALNQLLCNSMFVGRISAPDAPLDFYETAAVYFDANHTPFTMSLAGSLEPSQATPVSGLWPKRFDWLYRFDATTLQPQWQGLFWRPALYAYLAVFACAIAFWRRRDGRVFLIAAPAAITAIVLIPLTVGQGFRLVYPLFLCGLMLVPCAWLPAVSAPE